MMAGLRPFNASSSLSIRSVFPSVWLCIMYALFFTFLVSLYANVALVQKPVRLNLALTSNS